MNLGFVKNINVDDNKMTRNGRKMCIFIATILLDDSDFANSKFLTNSKSLNLTVFRVGQKIATF